MDKKGRDSIMLRCIVVAALFSSCVTAGNPVLDRGTRRAGVDFQISSSEVELEGAPGSLDTDDLDLSGEIGWFVAKQIEIGATGLFSYSEQDDGTTTTESSIVRLGPYARYYFTSTGGAIPFVTALVAYGGQEIDDGSTSIDGDGLTWGVGAGLLVPLSTSVAIEGTLAYIRDDFELDGLEFEADSISLTVGISAFF